MSGASKKLMGTTAAGGGALAIEDVFSTYLYTGNGSTQTITNGIDLAGEGGLVWIKERAATSNHYLHDTERGPAFNLRTNLTNAQQSTTWFTGFNSNGFGVQSSVLNGSGDSLASWTFRKAPRFFDVVTYTGTGSARTISHDLGLVPGCIIVKRTDTTGDWQVYHRSNTANPETDYLVLNSTAATADSSLLWNDTAPTVSNFTVGRGSNVNASGGTYVAYLFAHDPLGPSEDGSDGLIACGSFTTDGSNQATISLGWEPQWVLIKGTDNVSSWIIVDNMKGWANGSNDRYLFANGSNAEIVFNIGHPNSDGFFVNGFSTGNYIYIAIRRGPMRQPTSGTEVFAVDGGVTGTSEYAGFPVDMAIFNKDNTGDVTNVGSRLQGAARMFATSTAAEAAYTISYDSMDSLIVDNNSKEYSWMFRRAPGFFDVVAYTGDGVSGSQKKHNLGVVPEIVLIKRRNVTDNWMFRLNIGGEASSTEYMRLNETTALLNGGARSYTDAYFTETSDTAVNGSGNTYISYLFATLPGVSKVGRYTGNGTSKTIDCGFTSGARFILIKRTDSTGDWYVWDAARGIVTGDDPHLSLNTTAAEVTNDDSIDPDSSGFIVNQVAATKINVFTASYIFLAIA